MPTFLLLALLVLNATSFRETTITDCIDNKELTGVTGGLPAKSDDVVIFVYHRFGDDRYPSTNTSIDLFKSQIKYLKDNGYKLVTLSDALNSEKDKIAVITIDDAFDSFYENAWPMLQNMNIPVTLFVNTETVGGEDYMDWQQLGEVLSKGSEIGNHSHSHAYFLNLGEDYLDKFRKDVATAQRLFKENLNIQPQIFAYPYGEYSLEMKEAVKEMGFSAAVAQYSGAWNIDADKFAIPRFPVNTKYGDMDSFKEKASARSFHITTDLPERHVISEGESPEWKLAVSEDISPEKIQCYVQGGSCTLKRSGNMLIIGSEAPLTQRRTLYTITMPDKKGRWYWLSRVWINPAVGN